MKAEPTTSVKVEGKDVTVTVQFGDIGEVLVEFTIVDDVTGRWIFGMNPATSRQSGSAGICRW